MTTVLDAPVVTDPAPAQVVAITSEEPRELGMSDRCDACRAQAYVRADVEHLSSLGESVTTALTFCGHHAAKFWDTLVASATRIRDERAHIFSGSPVSASPSLTDD